MNQVMDDGSSTVPILKTKDDSISSNDNSRKLNVYIWDMDETLILLKSLLNGTYAQSFHGTKDLRKGVGIGKMWEDHILQLCDDYFFYEQIENYNQPFLDALDKYDDGRDLSTYDFNRDGFTSPCDDSNKTKLAYRHRVITEKYKQGLRGMFDKKMIKTWDDLYDLTDNYTDRWLSSARSFLKECLTGIKDPLTCLTSDGITGYTYPKLQHVNILVTSGSLIPSLVKCLLFRLDCLITYENVYSSWEVGKLKCFSWIKKRFSSQNAQFCVIGDGWEECEAAEFMKWPFIKIDMGPASTHQFPGLTLRTVGHYISVVYGETDDTKDDEK